MVKIYSRLDRLLNVSICVHFPSKNFFFFFFSPRGQPSQPAGLGGSKISHLYVSNCSRLFRVFKN